MRCGSQNLDSCYAMQSRPKNEKSQNAVKLIKRIRITSYGENYLNVAHNNIKWPNNIKMQHSIMGQQQVQNPSRPTPQNETNLLDLLQKNGAIPHLQSPHMSICICSLKN